MSDIFSLTDILIAIFFIVPGFVTLSIIRRIGLFENELKDQEMVIWSILFSLIIFSLFSLKFQISNIDNLRTTVFNWEQTVWVIGLAVGLGLGIGYFIKFKFRRDTHRGKLWGNVVGKIDSLPSYPRVRVVTDDKEYEGTLFLWGKEFTARDILLVYPFLIKIDPNGNETKISQGHELFIPEESIKSVNFLDKVTFFP